MSSALPERVDYALVGGGLQNALVALALRRERPDATVAIIERGATLGGNHLWSLHAGDLSPLMASVVDPLVIQRWPSHSVHFPGVERVIDASYATLSSDRLHEVVSAQLGPNLHVALSASARHVEADRVVMDDGSVVHAGVVIDARGPGRLPASSSGGYQKFVGIEFEVDGRLPLTRPVLMDARVPQTDGYRFFYVLPLSERRVLIEDTYFSDTPLLDMGTIRAAIGAYAVRLGLERPRLVREERGVLPLPTRMPPRPTLTGPFVGGFAGGWFHPTTGYSLPVAARFAEVVACTPGRRLHEAVRELAGLHESQCSYGTLLNRLLFGAFAPEDRWNVFERFYRLPTQTILRFYSMNLTYLDRARILCGRPPRGFSLRIVLERRAAALGGAAA